MGIDDRTDVQELPKQNLARLAAPSRNAGAAIPPKSAKLIAAAYHVAAQAVAARHLCEPFTRAVIALDRNGDTIGYVVFRNLSRSFQRLNNRGVALTAGFLAQRRHNPKSVQMHLVAFDQQIVELCASRAARSPAMKEALVALWTARAREFVRSEKDCIARVATALLERRTLMTGEVAAAIMLTPENGSAGEVVHLCGRSSALRGAAAPHLAVINPDQAA